MFRQRKTIVGVLLAAGALGLFCGANKPQPPAPGPAYTLAQLKVAAGFTASYGTDVNDNGQVVGFMTTTSGQQHAVVWANSSAVPTDLNNGLLSYASVINNRGQVAGGCIVDTIGNAHPVVWIPGGLGGYEMIDLTGGDPNVIDGITRDINDSGMLAGSFLDADGFSWGFVVVPEDANEDGKPDTWFRDDDHDGVNDLMLTFRVFVTPPWTESSAINDMGWVIGTCDVLSDGWDYSGYFLIIPDYTLPNPWFDDANNDGLNDLAICLSDGGYSDSRIGVNNHGQVVVRDAQLFEVAQDRSFTQTMLPPPSSAYRWVDFDMGINDSGQVVGTGKISKPNGAYDPFLWQKDKGTMRLESLVSDMAGFSDLTSGVAINNHGQIVGAGTTHGPARILGHAQMTASGQDPAASPAAPDDLPAQAVNQNRPVSNRREAEHSPASA